LLLEFKFSNFRSFYEEQSLSFVASPLKGRIACVRDVTSPLADKVLPISVLYGANASGKSNATKALKFMVEQVLGSFSQSEKNKKINRMPFALKGDARETASRFEAAFMIEGVSYEYGFELNDTLFLKEWLNAYPKGKVQKWYSRDGGKYKFSDNLKGQKDSLSKITPDNSLFLSVAMRSDVKQLVKITDFFESIKFDLSANINEENLSERIREKRIDSRTIAFLNSIETGIQGYKLLPKQISTTERQVANAFVENIDKLEGMLFDLVKLNNPNISREGRLSEEEIEEFRGELIDDLNKKIQVFFTHSGADDDVLGIAFSDESEGTKRLVRLVEDAFIALDTGKVFVVDELDASLHTRACTLFVKLFLDAEINKNGAQLFATTHDTNLLSDHAVRRDEAWFVEKDSLGQSKLYSASEFRVRKDQNLEDVYLDDRFGALPPKVDPKWLLTN